MIFLGFGKYVRADKIYALEPLAEGERGHGARTRVWVEGIARADRRVAHRARDHRGDGRATRRAEATRILDGALDLAQRVADAAEQGRFDVVDLGRRARRLLESTTDPAEPESPVLIGRSFFARDVHEVARDLIGAELLVDGVGGLIVEVEAYAPDDPASHGYRGRTARNAVDVRAARARLRLPLLRHPLVPQLRLRARRGRERGPRARARADSTGSRRCASGAASTSRRLLCSGPGRLCQALGVTGEHDGLPLDRPPFELRDARRGDPSSRSGRGSASRRRSSGRGATASPARASSAGRSGPRAP